MNALKMALAASSVTVALSAAAAETTVALTDDALYLQRIESVYLATAGSADNLANLADGLRTATPVTLVEANPDGTLSTLTFTPPTRPMGYGNITHTLDYATRDLAAAGIDSPTAEQLHAALMGGTVTNAAGETTQLAGVLQLRSHGMGWGKIAHTLDISPSPHSKAAFVPSDRGAAVTVKPTSGKATGITTAGGAKLNATSSGKPSKSGIVTASGGGASQARYSSGNGHAKSGIVTAGGTSAGVSGVVNAQGNGVHAGGLAGGRVSTAGGGSGNGNAFGKSKH
ncbi:MAG: hypothetical protein ACAH06_11840 [Methylophilaceae bacterium]|jgi:hypothetical protein|uniref:hypothetical protein n=1 Tax=Methylobacillus sp. MM3 TaxID=1848039 RepID=UPI0007E0C641|nr:hypothetical protein [Methylobacillus sp. MM3]OAJ69465.1 hypothetical protein A7976_04380 [Methylobacillus sp. MM3]